MGIVTEDFTRKFQDEVIQIQAEFTTSPNIRHGLKNHLDETILHELTLGLMKELKSHIKVDTRSLREGPTGSTHDKDEVHHTRLFIMTEDTYNWLVPGIRELLDKLRRIETVIEKKI